MVHIAGPLHCRITRRYGGRSQPLDDDNLSGGCKGLRDAIAAMLGLKGDSQKDGITFEYAQERVSETDQPGIEIAIFSSPREIS
jgi:hypothetical protein